MNDSIDLYVKDTIKNQLLKKQAQLRAEADRRGFLSSTDV